MREISVEGLQLLGAGANGRVFKLNDEQIVKVYNPLTNPFEKIEKEKEVAKKAFVKGVPTAISYDVVKCGNCYGAVYEMLHAETVGAVVKKNPERAAELGYGAVLFEGNIGFYGKCGFVYASSLGIRYHDLPEDADSSFFLCRELIPGYLNGRTGVYQTPQVYYVSEEDVLEFDKGFPEREKLKLPWQIF